MNFTLVGIVATQHLVMLQPTNGQKVLSLRAAGAGRVEAGLHRHRQRLFRGAQPRNFLTLDFRRAAPPPPPSP